MMKQRFKKEREIAKVTKVMPLVDIWLYILFLALIAYNVFVFVNLYNLSEEIYSNFNIRDTSLKISETDSQFRYEKMNQLGQLIDDVQLAMVFY